MWRQAHWLGIHFNSAYYLANLFKTREKRSFLNCRLYFRTKERKMHIGALGMDYSLDVANSNNY